MRSEAELERIADAMERSEAFQPGALERLGEEELYRQVMEVIGDVRGEELEPLAEILGRRAQEHLEMGRALRICAHLKSSSKRDDAKGS